MQSILIVGKNREKLKEEAKKICSENRISKFDVDIIGAEKAVGIGEIRKLQEKIFLKPLFGDKKAVILEAFYEMTIQAQNAFLKILEEPPQSTIIIVLCTSQDFILPTILSRCNLIILEKIKDLTAEEIKKNLEILKNIKENGAGFALVIAQDNSKTREAALKFLEDLIISLNDNLENSENAGKTLKELQSFYTIIKSTNVSPRFALENLFLDLLSG